MPRVISYHLLHLNCRLFISSLNADINALRINGDYLDALRESAASAAAAERIATLTARFPGVRAEIDELRNDLHLVKMKLGSYIRQNKPVADVAYKESRYDEVKKRFNAFRKSFDALQKEVCAVEES